MTTTTEPPKSTSPPADAEATATGATATPAEDPPAGGEVQEDRSELDRLAGNHGLVTLATGTEIRVKDMRTREFFAIMRILTRGAGSMIAAQQAMGTSPEELQGQLLGYLIVSIPEAPNESVDFIRQIVEPANLETLPENERIGARAALWDELENPAFEDTLTIIETVIAREAADIAAMGKRLAAAFTAARAKNVDMKRATRS